MRKQNGAPGFAAYRTPDEASADVFDYIERFYNTKRRHSTMIWWKVEEARCQTFWKSSAI